MYRMVNYIYIYLTVHDSPDLSRPNGSHQDLELTV